MARQKRAKENGAGLNFEEKLWQAADKRRGHMDAAEYKHVVLGLVFLKYISDAFQEHYDKLTATPGAEPEDRDEYTADRVFWVPKEARWAGENGLQAKAKQPTIGKLVDDAMVAIEKENRHLKGVLPKDYARPTLDKTKLAGTDRPREHHRAGGRRQPREGHPGPGVRILPQQVRQGRGASSAASSTPRGRW